MMQSKAKDNLFKKLKADNHLWSYDNARLNSISDDVLIENVLLHLDIDDINILFQLYPYKKIKDVWKENIAIQGPRYYTLNKFYAWYYFHAKCPGAYVKSLETRHLHKLQA